MEHHHHHHHYHHSSSVERAGPCPFSKHVIPKCPFVTIKVKKDNVTAMRKLLKPFCKHVPTLSIALDVVEKESSFHSISWQQAQAPPYSVSEEQLSSPAIAIILLLPENGPHGANVAKTIFRKIPWQLHHMIQAKDKHSLNVIGSQEFYSMSRAFPLWSMIASPGPLRRMRIQIFSWRYNAMIEFYRLVTNSEMESQKPGFCVFPLSPEIVQGCRHLPSPPGQDRVPCELALKQCAHINPYPLHNVSLTFPVENFAYLLTVLQSQIQPLSPRHYLVRDPDGNAVVLYDVTSVASTDSMTSPVPVHSSSWTPDKISAHSDSIDSGHFSDIDFL